MDVDTTRKRGADELVAHSVLLGVLDSPTHSDRNTDRNNEGQHKGRKTERKGNTRREGKERGQRKDRNKGHVGTGKSETARKGTDRT